MIDEIRDPGFFIHHGLCEDPGLCACQNSSLSIACADTGRDFQWQGAC